MSYQMNRVAGQLGEVERILAGQAGVPIRPPTAGPAPVAPIPVPARPAPVPVHPVPVPRPPVPAPPPPRVPLTERLTADGGQGWIGKLLAVAGVAVTLVGVVLLLVLAAQAGILRPEIRVAAGGVLAAGLVGVAVRWNRRAGGRTGAIALAATGVAAAYIDVVAVTTIYEWVAPAVGLLLAAVIGGAGLTLARRWDSQHLGLLVLVPLLILAPIVVDGISLLMIGFMLALSAAALPVQLGRDWIWLHAARTAAATGSAADRPGRNILRFGRGPVATRRCLRRGGAAGRRRCADPFAVDGKPGGDGAADGGRHRTGAAGRSHRRTAPWVRCWPPHCRPSCWLSSPAGGGSRVWPGRWYRSGRRCPRYRR